MEMRLLLSGCRVPLIRLPPSKWLQTARLVSGKVAAKYRFPVIVEELGLAAAERAPRLSSRLYPSVAGSVHFWCGGREERGLIHDISRTGARIAETTARVQPGEQVELFFLLGANPRRIKAVASVVRRTPTGFAVRFLRIQRELERLVLAATPEPGTR